MNTQYSGPSLRIKIVVCVNTIRKPPGLQELVGHPAVLLLSGVELFSDPVSMSCVEMIILCECREIIDFIHMYQTVGRVTRRGRTEASSEAHQVQHTGQPTHATTHLKLGPRWSLEAAHDLYIYM